MLKVNKIVLFIIAGLVWFIAGANILRIGIKSFGEVGFSSSMTWILLAIAVVIFMGFFFMFAAMVRRHKARIMGYVEDKVSILKFMDAKGYILMIFMMGLGIGLRHSNLLPTEFFASFYSGLGLGLVIAGVRFLWAGISFGMSAKGNATK